MSNAFLLNTEIGHWREITLEPPLSVLVGDKVGFKDGKLFVERNGVIAHEREIETQGTEIPWTAFETNQSIESFVYFRRRTMAVALTITDVRVQGASVFVDYSDSSQDETTLVDIQGVHAEVHSVDFAKKILKANLIALEPALENADATNGTTVSIDMQGDTPIVLTRNI